MARTLIAASTSAGLSRQRQGLSLMIVGGLLLGTVGVFVQEAGQAPLTAVWFRCLFGGLFLVAWAWGTGRASQLRLDTPGWRAAGGAGVMMIVSWALFFAAIERTSIAVATVVFHVHPLWVLVWAAIACEERADPRQVAAAALAFVGLVAASGAWEAMHGTGGFTARQWEGLAMCAGGSICYAGVALIATRCGLSSFTLAWWQCVAGTLLVTPWIATQGWPASASSWAWLAGLGMIHTGLAYVVLYAGMARLSTAHAVVLQFVYPAAAIGVDRLVYGHTLTWLQCGGIVLMGWALVVIARSRIERPRQ